MRLIVTRPAAQARAWLHALRAAGIEASALPLIDIAAAEDVAPVQAAWRELSAFGFVMFVSANAVQHFFALRPTGASWPPVLQAGATGPGTAAALREAGLAPDRIVMPDAAAGRFDSEALWSRLADRPWRGVSVLVVRGEQGRDWLAERWQAAGARVTFVAAYRRQAPHIDAAAHALLDEALQRPAAAVWHFSSSEAVRNLGELAPRADWHAALAWVTHERIAQAAASLGFGRVRLIGPAVDDVVAALAVLSDTPQPDPQQPDPSMRSVQSRAP